MAIQWHSSYEVGDERIDFEHRIFLNLIAKMARDVADGRDTARLRRTFTEILKYGEFHFLSEENLMIDAEYPGYAEHRALHAALLSTLRGRHAEFVDARIDATELVAFLLDWFVKHTISEDIRIGHYLADRPRAG